MYTPPKIKFGDVEALVVVRRYTNDRVALCLETPQRTPIITATINIPDAALDPDQVIIKNYSENEGVLAALVQAELIQDSGIDIPAGHTHGDVCRLLFDPQTGQHFHPQ